MRLVRLLLPALLAAQPALASASVDLLNTPATPSVRAAQSLMTDLVPQADGFLLTGERGLLLTWKAKDHWQQQASPVSVGLTAASPLANGGALAVGQDGVILRRNGDGSAWTKVFDGYDLTRLQIRALKQRHKELQQHIENASEDEDTGELEYQLEELGFNLEDARAELESGPTKPLLDVVASGSRLFAVGAYGTLLASDDNGSRWQLFSARVDNPDRYYLNAVARDASGNLFIVGEAGLGFVSRDNGETWETLDLPYDGSLFGIATGKHDDLVAFGLQGNVLISRNGGADWQHLHIDGGASLLGGTLDDSGRAFLVGHGGLVASFPLADPDAITLRKHPSGAALSSVAVDGDQLILAGQFGVSAWPIDNNALDNNRSASNQ